MSLQSDVPSIVPAKTIHHISPNMVGENLKKRDGKELEEPGPSLGKTSQRDSPVVDGEITADTTHKSIDAREATSINDILDDKSQLKYRVGELLTDIDKFGDEILESERNKEQLDLRSMQAIYHHALSNLRIQHLEKELQRLTAAVYNEEFDAKERDLDEPKCPEYKHELRVSGMADFRLDRTTVLLPAEQQPALEVQLHTETSPRIFKQERDVDFGEMPIDRTWNPSMSQHGDGYGTAPARLRIRSFPLISYLQETLGPSLIIYPREDEVDDNKVFSPLVFLRPFKLLIRHEADIREGLNSVQLRIEADSGDSTGNEKVLDNQTLLTDLKLLIQFLDIHLHSTFLLRQSIKDGTAAEIEYLDLWHLFERGEPVVMQSHEQHAYLVLNIAGGREPLIDRLPTDEAEGSSPVNGFVVDCLSLGHDGNRYVPKLDSVSIKRFHGAKAISSLAVYPLRFHPQADALRARFIKEGTKFAKLVRDPFCHRRVKGDTLDEPRQKLDAQIIIDMALAMEARNEWRLKKTVSFDELTQRDKRETRQEPWCRHKYNNEPCCGSDIIVKDLKMDDLDTEIFLSRIAKILSPFGDEELTDDELILIRPEVHAFVLRSRQWVTVRTADIHDVVFENNFDDLVLPAEHKKTVQALVRTHENMHKPHDSSIKYSSIGSALDLVKGKGSGLVILLHGPPGVGKTSTAECVADDTRRPLYPITCGDIGETPSEVESNLQYNFQLAHKWGCVLLLDEADIFLSRRNRTDLRRNAVTSVFLRSLEYYGGILFLTTNRVGVIDPAFKSRIQMALLYERLDAEVSCKLYEKFIQRARDEQERTDCHLFKIKEKEILRFARRHYRHLEKRGCETWNGRYAKLYTPASSANCTLP